MDGANPTLRLARPRVSVRRALACAGALGMIALQQAAGTSASTDVGRTTRTYAAKILSASGSYARASGRITITLTLDQIGPAGQGGEYTVLITLRGAGCGTRARRGCLTLSGTIRGRGESRRVNPDIAPEIAIKAASGQIRPLGRVSARGELRGTGFIATGHRTSRITLTARHGSLSVYGEGPRVRGFTAP